MVILSYLIYSLIIIMLVSSLIFWAIPEAINDNKWGAYMEAYDKWEKNGKNGKMPVPEDFGYKGITEKEEG